MDTSCGTRLGLLWRWVRDLVWYSFGGNVLLEKKKKKNEDFEFDFVLVRNRVLLQAFT